MSTSLTPERGHQYPGYTGNPHPEGAEAEHLRLHLLAMSLFGREVVARLLWTDFRSVMVHTSGVTVSHSDMQLTCRDPCSGAWRLKPPDGMGARHPLLLAVLDRAGISVAEYLAAGQKATTAISVTAQQAEAAILAALEVLTNDPRGSL